MDTHLDMIAEEKFRELINQLKKAASENRLDAVHHGR